jgi:hypothetical protein
MFISLCILFSQNINKSVRKPLIPTILSDIVTAPAPVPVKDVGSLLTL